MSKRATAQTKLDAAASATSADMTLRAGLAAGSEAGLPLGERPGYSGPNFLGLGLLVMTTTMKQTEFGS